MYIGRVTEIQPWRPTPNPRLAIHKTFPLCTGCFITVQCTRLKTAEKRKTEDLSSYTWFGASFHALFNFVHLGSMPCKCLRDSHWMPHLSRLAGVNEPQRCPCELSLTCTEPICNAHQPCLSNSATRQLHQALFTIQSYLAQCTTLPLLKGQLTAWHELQ